MARLYEHARCLTAQNGSFRPWQKQSLEALFTAADAALPGKPVTVNYRGVSILRYTLIK
jgi:hypothetical protein